MQKECLFCKKEFTKPYNCSLNSWKDRTKFCSKQCQHLSMKGKAFLPKGFKRTWNSPTQFKKGGSIPKVPSESRKRGPENNKWKGGDISKECIMCNKIFSVQRYRAEIAKTCSVLCKHKYIHTPEYRSSLSKKHKQRVLDGKHNLYRGYSTKVELLRQSSEYKIWRESVYKRDNYTCVLCCQVGGKLNADHIKPFCIFPELALEVSNGRTLCIACHRKTDTYAKRSSTQKKLFTITNSTIIDLVSSETRGNNQI
jgi:hypothetical protein